MPRISSARCDRPGGDRALLLAIDRDEIRKVVLALLVGGADAVERGEQRREIEGVDAGVDFGDLAFCVGEASRSSTIFVMRAAGADDAAVAEGPRQLRGDHGRGRVGLGVRREQRLQRARRTAAARRPTAGRRCRSCLRAAAASAAARGRFRAAAPASRTAASVRFASDAFTSSAPWPTTTVMLAGNSAERSAGRVR